MGKLLAIAVLLAAFSSAGNSKKSHPSYVPDQRTAERIAEAVLIARYGEERVKRELPLLVGSGGSNNEYWIVQVAGQEKGVKGGGMAVMIKKHSGCIMNVMEYMK